MAWDRREVAEGGKRRVDDQPAGGERRPQVPVLNSAISAARLTVVRRARVLMG